MYEEKLWTEKYRPQTIDDCILPTEIKGFFKGIVEKGELPNLLMDGAAGCGKTTVAKALCNEMGFDYLFVNASESRNIDTLRTTIRDYASTVSLTGGKKVIILDEADYLNPTSTQPALRGFMEEFSKNARFLLTCNFKAKILDPLQSRCSLVSFKIPKNERGAIAKEFAKRLMKILKEEGIEYDNATIAQLVKRHFPDFRKMINEVNRYSVSGKIDADIFSYMDHTPVSELIGHLKKGEYDKISDWTETTDLDQEAVFEEFRKNRHLIFADASRADFDLCLWQFAESADRVQNPRINMQGFLVTIMKECEFK